MSEFPIRIFALASFLQSREIVYFCEKIRTAPPLKWSEMGPDVCGAVGARADPSHSHLSTHSNLARLTPPAVEFGTLPPEKPTEWVILSNSKIWARTRAFDSVWWAGSLRALGNVACKWANNCASGRIPHWPAPESALFWDSIASVAHADLLACPT